MKKMKKILAFCLCAMLMTTVPTFTETASAATTSSKKTTSTTTKKKTTIKGWYKLKTGGMRYFKNGKYITGCHKIGKYVYLFNKNGFKAQKNTTYKGVQYFIDDYAHVTGWRKGSTFYYNNGKAMSANKALDFRAYQNARNVIKKNLDMNQDGEYFTFYDGPPTANGKPHIGHILTRVMKDIIPRYKVMKGY